MQTMLLMLSKFADNPGVDKTCKNDFFGLNPWFQYLDVQRVSVSSIDASKTACTVVNFNFPGDITLVLLALLDDILRLAGLVAIGYVIWGGISYVTSRGEPDATKRAQTTIMNALIGLVISLISVVGVAFVGNALGAK